ncbi:MAG: hypothetical protein ACM3ML_07735 [Micromonosporaceae bacterium]
MHRTGYPPAPLGARLRDEFRSARAARAARKSLARELASYTSPGDRADLDAILDRYPPDQTADIRRILAAQRLA